MLSFYTIIYNDIMHNVLRWNQFSILTQHLQEQIVKYTNGDMEIRNVCKIQQNI